MRTTASREHRSRKLAGETKSKPLNILLISSLFCERTSTNPWLIKIIFGCVQNINNQNILGLKNNWRVSLRIIMFQYVQNSNNINGQGKINWNLVTPTQHMFLYAWYHTNHLLNNTECNTTQLFCPKIDGSMASNTTVPGFRSRSRHQQESLPKSQISISILKSRQKTRCWIIAYKSSNLCS